MSGTIDVSAEAATASASPPVVWPRARDTILLGGIAVAVLDGLAAVTVAWLRGGVPPVRVFQYIASGLLGRDAFVGGWETAGIGILLHVTIAFGVATAYHLGSRVFPVLLRHTVAGGAVYGLVVFFTMRQIVIPISAVTRPPFSLSGMLTGMTVHVLFVGLPVALVARRSAGLERARRTAGVAVP